ncbi:MAG: AraC family transcriptional regulator [Propionibacteriaceae bacterium]|nr:AraC family transcriptional regulator [Propionibacteriaceae bacterium]
MGLEHLRHLRRAGRVLEPGLNPGVVEHGRVPADGALGELVLHQWWVRWKFGADGPRQRRVLSDPVIHLTFESGSGPLHGFPTPVALVHGVVPEVFEVTLPSEGRVTGMAFQPGALATVCGLDARDLTGRVVLAAEIFGDDVERLRDVVVAEPAESIRREIVADWLAPTGEPGSLGDPAYRLVRRACELVEDSDLTRVEDLAAAVHVSPRTLQRIFPRLVGVAPLWVIRRRRLQRVAERLDSGEAVNLAQLASELGFADQAHLTREFRRVIGRPPAAYRQG